MTKKEIVPDDCRGTWPDTTLQAQQIVQKTFDSIVNTLVADGRVELRNFGVFAVKRRKPSWGPQPAYRREGHGARALHRHLQAGASDAGTGEDKEPAPLVIPVDTGIVASATWTTRAWSRACSSTIRRTGRAGWTRWRPRSRSGPGCGEAAQSLGKRQPASLGSALTHETKLRILPTSTKTPIRTGGNRTAAERPIAPEKASILQPPWDTGFSGGFFFALRPQSRRKRVCSIDILVWRTVSRQVQAGNPRFGGLYETRPVHDMLIDGVERTNLSRVDAVPDEIKEWFTGAASQRATAVGAQQKRPLGYLVPGGLFHV